MVNNLSYSRSRWCSLVHYMQYLSLTASEKTRWLCTLAKQDPFYATIVTTLQAYGCHVQHRFYGRNGVYLPMTIQMTEACTLEDAVKKQHVQGNILAEFSFSSRYGGAQISHYWLHELTHFWQDLHGVFLTPLIQKDTLPVMLDAPSHIAVTCLCEAMAETEALRGSWRLKEHGYPIAWQGALASLDWGAHARAYAKDMQILSETEAARNAFDRWYASRQRVYYEKRALRAYMTRINDLHLDDAAAMSGQFRRVDFDQLIRMLPQPEAIHYLTSPDGMSLNDALYWTIRCADTRQAVRALEVQFGQCGNTNFRDIRSGAAPYIWKSSLAFNRDITDNQ